MIPCCFYSIFLIFFQAEDGIRDIGVTGVQTCALPISGRVGGHGLDPSPSAAGGSLSSSASGSGHTPASRPSASSPRASRLEIGRASCRGREEISVVAVSLKQNTKQHEYNKTLQMNLDE